VFITHLDRYGAAIRNAHERRRTIRALNSLPPEVQKDIGWPVASWELEQTNIINAIWGTAR
jgi:hypothetical protein